MERGGSGIKESLDSKIVAHEKEGWSCSLVPERHTYITNAPLNWKRYVKLREIRIHA